MIIEIDVILPLTYQLKLIIELSLCLSVSIITTFDNNCDCELRFTYSPDFLINSRRLSRVGPLMYSQRVGSCEGFAALSADMIALVRVYF